MTMKMFFAALIKPFASNTAALGMAIILSLSASVQTHAQDSSFDDIPLNGLAAFEQLRKEYYIGGLYLETLSQDTGSVINISGKKRMELRITIGKWSPRRFASQWNQAILINNDQESLEEFADEILAFTDLPKDDLVTGDKITIDRNSDSGTTIYLNGVKAVSSKSGAFFDLLLNVWIGQRPPSSDFKNEILTLPTDQAGTELLIRYDATIPQKSREKLAAGWYKSSTSTSSAKKSVAAAAAVATSAAKKSSSSAAGAVAPPGSGTKVTAKRSSSSPQKKKPVAVVKPKIVTPKPKVELEKPKIAASKIAKPPAPKKPAPKAKPKPKPKPAPVVVAKAAPKPAQKKASAADVMQKKLKKAYRSNVLKLTYLNTQYPKRAMDFKQEGLVILKVKVNRAGKVIEVIEEKTSDHKLLNKAARRAVSKTAPYPEVPKDLAGEEIEFSLPFNFKL